ncbi:MAG TPA: response regulator [Salinarimonas sp.]|nr:response regulator [Salinarimonas sp.]
MATIHIIEDDWGVRDALIELVRGHGRQVQAYESGEAFMAAASPGPDDLVVVDLGLPGVGGQHVVKWLKALAAPPRIVAISGRPRLDIVAALRDLPGLPLLRKPLAPEAITPYL